METVQRALPLELTQMLLPRIRSLEGASPVTAEGASHVLDDGSVCDVFFDN